MFKKLLLPIFLIATIIMAGPALASKGDVEIAYVEWDCATATSYLMKAVLEDMGYDVKLVPVSAAAMWQSIASGDADAMVCAWLPTTHGHYLKKIKDDVVDLGPNLKGTRIGWVVPQYVTIDSISQLKDNPDKFDKKIIGIDPGAGLMSKSEKAMKVYGLEDWKLVEGSGATMAAALGNAIKNNEWVVVTGWSPHWKFGRWELKYLEDPKNVFGGAEYIHTIVRKGLDKDMPEVYKVLDNFHWDPPQLEGLMAENQDPGADLLENAQKWVKNHPDMVKQWKQ